MPIDGIEVPRPKSLGLQVGDSVQCAHCLNSFALRQRTRVNPTEGWQRYDCPMCEKTSQIGSNPGSEPVKVPDTL